MAFHVCQFHVCQKGSFSLSCKNGRETFQNLRLQFTYWVGGLAVEPACASSDSERNLSCLHTINILQIVKETSLSPILSIGSVGNVLFEVSSLPYAQERVKIDHFQFNWLYVIEGLFLALSNPRFLLRDRSLYRIGLGARPDINLFSSINAKN